MYFILLLKCTVAVFLTTITDTKNLFSSMWSQNLQQCLILIYLVEGCRMTVQ